MTLSLSCLVTLITAPYFPQRTMTHYQKGKVIFFERFEPLPFACLVIYKLQGLQRVEVKP